MRGSEIIRNRSTPGLCGRGLAAGLLILATVGVTDRVGALEPEAAVRAGRSALRGQAFPWYDTQQDSLRRIDVQPAAEPAVHRDSTWETIPRESRERSWPPEMPLWVGQLVRVLIWTALALGLVALIGLLARAYVTREMQRSGSDGRASPDDRADTDRIVDLALPIRMPGVDLLRETRRLYEQADYARAILYLFSYQLQMLDRYGLIQLARGKTNRQYTAELAAQPQLRAILQRSMVGFEDVFFGHHPMNKQRFEACWFQLDAFHHRIEQGTSS